jgi:hypothetical protein
MSDICEQFCPVYEACIRTFDAATLTRSSLLSQRQAIDDLPGLADLLDRAQNQAALPDMTDEEIDQFKAEHRAQIAASQDKLDYRLSLNETELAGTARSMLEVAAAQATCPGPKLSFLGRVAVAARALRRHRRPIESDRQAALEYFAKCSSAAAKAALADLPESLY